MVAGGLPAVVFMMSASSPMHSFMPVYRVRLPLTGIFFAAGGTLVVHSPLGQRCGGYISLPKEKHVNETRWCSFGSKRCW